MPGADRDPFVWMVTSALSKLSMGVGRSEFCPRSLDAMVSGEIHCTKNLVLTKHESHLSN